MKENVEEEDEYLLSNIRKYITTNLKPMYSWQENVKSWKECGSKITSKHGYIVFCVPSLLTYLFGSDRDIPADVIVYIVP